MRDEVQVDQVSGLLTRCLQQRAMPSQKQNWIKRGAFIRTPTAAIPHEGVARHQVLRIKQRTAHDKGNVLITMAAAVVAVTVAVTDATTEQRRQEAVPKYPMLGAATEAS